MKSRLVWLLLVCASARSVQAQDPGAQEGPASAEEAQAPSPLVELEAQRAALDARIESLTAASAAPRTAGPLIAMGVSAAVFSSMVLASSTRGQHTGDDPDVILLSYTPLPGLALAASWLTLGIRNHRQRARAAQLSDLIPVFT